MISQRIGGRWVNDAVPVSSDGFLTTAGLAARPDFTLGLAIVSPSTRTIAGPGGTADVEPRVMQVLVVLADAAGHVVTRETLFQRCWGGLYVGDDSLNRAIGAVRKLDTEIAGESFGIETIPRTGYRLTGAVSAVGSPAPTTTASAGRLTRRQLAIGGLGAVALAGGGLWAAIKAGTDRRFDELMARGEHAVRAGSSDQPTGAEPTERIFEEAVRIRPGSARAWGLLALVRSFLALGADSTGSGRAIEAAEAAARRAFGLDPKEPNALLAMFELQGSTLDWATRDQRLRRIIAIDPKNIIAITELLSLLQAAGLNRESWEWNERGLAIEPLSPDLIGRRALKLWIAGRVSEADKVIDQARALWPSDPWQWWVRFLILALSNRARAAQALLDSDPAKVGSPPEVALWRTCLPALNQRSPANLAKARQACLEGAKSAGELAAMSVMILSAIAEVDTAFDVANGFLLSRGSIVRQGQSAANQVRDDTGWRVWIQWLFTPACAAMRADPRFLQLCEGIGLVDYWRTRGVRPDYQLTEA